MKWSEVVAREAEAIRAAGRWRSVRDLDGRGPRGDLAGVGPVTSFAAHDSLDRWGAGAGSARLVVGARPVHAELEAELAAWRSSEAAVLFPTGFAANLGVLSTF